jgi:hypothetical protein
MALSLRTGYGNVFLRFPLKVAWTIHVKCENSFYLILYTAKRLIEEELSERMDFLEFDKM